MNELERHKGLKTLLVLLGSFTVFMLYSVVSTKAQTASDSEPCQLTKNNIYANQDLSVEDKMALYHKTINEKFNAYLKMMIKAGPGNQDGLPPENETECSETNYSAFCVAQRLLTDPNYGYMAYHKALTCNKYALFETTKEESEQEGPGADKQYQTAKVLAISARLEGIEREIGSAKRALDQTLAAYNELRSAWPMHKKYVEIYNNLVKYRDKLAEIRSQAEDFPAKFIDATTTKCT